MGFVKSVAIAIVALLSVYAVERSPVLLGLASRAVLPVLFFVVSLFDAHGQIY